MNIQEHENKMTIFFRKANGDIKRTNTGIHNMSMFGKESEDYSLIWDYVVLDRDDYVLGNSINFRVNPVSKKLELKESPMKYETVRITKEGL